MPKISKIKENDIFRNPALKRIIYELMFREHNSRTLEKIKGFPTQSVIYRSLEKLQGLGFVTNKKRGVWSLNKVALSKQAQKEINIIDLKIQKYKEEIKKLNITKKEFIKFTK